MSAVEWRERHQVGWWDPCAGCGVEWLFHDQRRRYCDDCYASRGLAVVKTRNAVCAECGEPMPVKTFDNPFSGGTIESPTKRIDARYCSNACRQSAYRRRKGNA